MASWLYPLSLTLWMKFQDLRELSRDLCQVSFAIDTRGGFLGPLLPASEAAIGSPSASGTSGRR